MEKFTWTVKFTVDETWVADGFELTEELAKDMIQNQIPYSFEEETSIKIIKTPKRSDILKAQGYINEETKYNGNI